MICSNRAKRRIPCEIVIFTRITLHIAAELSGSSSETYKHVCAHRKSAVRCSSSICELERSRGRAEKSNKTSSELLLQLLQLRLATPRAAAGGSSQVSYARRSSLSTHMRDDVNIRRSHCRTAARARKPDFNCRSNYNASETLTYVCMKIHTYNAFMSIIIISCKMCRGGVLRACNNIPRLGTRRKSKKKEKMCDKAETRAKQAPSHTCMYRCSTTTTTTLRCTLYIQFQLRHAEKLAPQVSTSKISKQSNKVSLSTPNLAWSLALAYAREQIKTKLAATFI
uniref:Uncharacterized protein n=1 Tax=Trichogramma kaykai TaxID=54128 RepID=A0ABD2VUX3_9HYME